MKVKISVAVRMLQSEGHTVFPKVVNGRFCFKIDGEVLLSCDEMAQLADRIYTLAELHKFQARPIGAISKVQSPRAHCFGSVLKLLRQWMLRFFTRSDKEYRIAKLNSTLPRTHS